MDPIGRGRRDLFHRQTGWPTRQSGKHPGACLTLFRPSKIAVHRPSSPSNVLAHREAAQAVRIDSRTQIPLFIANAIYVNEKQPLSDEFMKKVFVRSVSGTNGKTEPPRHRCRGGSNRQERELGRKAARPTNKRNQPR
jgi:hypothetical protein